ncbi:Triosephosphate isomerase [Lactococcus lactis]|nr:Triosephosphate isomerase [Lactococcus lactis]
MSRKPIIAGNWKMNKTLSEAQAFVEAVKNNLPSSDNVESVIGAPALFLAPMAYLRQGSELKLAAENSYFENAGAFTGENSPAAIVDLGVKTSSSVTANVVNISTKLTKTSTKKQKQSSLLEQLQSFVVVKLWKLLKLEKQLNGFQVKSKLVLLA